jgi:hypothetical protein
LGPREGLRVSHLWQPPPPPPPLIVRAANSASEILFPVLLLLPLFLFKPNRCAPAWAIWLPVAVSLCGAIAFVTLASGGEKDLLHAFGAFVVALAATWLLSPYLQSRHRGVVCLKTVPVLAGFSLLAFLPRLLGERAGFFDFRLAFVGAFGVVSLGVGLALVLGGWAVRHRFGRVRFLGSMALCLWLVLTLSGAVVAILTSGSPDWGDLFLGVVITSGVILGLLLPLLLLSFFQPFYRARFNALLNVSKDLAAVRPEASPTTSALLNQRGDPAAPMK